MIDYVHNAGLKFGLGVMPFCVSVDSEMVKAHPEYFLRNDQGRLAEIHLDDIDTRVVLFDVSHPDAQKEIEQSVKTIIKEWNIDILKVDMLASNILLLFSIMRIQHLISLNIHFGENLMLKVL